MADGYPGDAPSPLAVLRQALDDFKVEDRDVERRLEWPRGQLARLLDDADPARRNEDGVDDDPGPYQQVWIALLILVLERWMGREQDDRPYPFDSSTSFVAEPAGEYEAFETDDHPAPEVGLTPTGLRSLEQASLVMSRELTGVFLDLTNRLYRTGEGEEVEPFDHFIQTAWQRIEQRGGPGRNRP